MTKLMSAVMISMSFSLLNAMDIESGDQAVSARYTDYYPQIVYPSPTLGAQSLHQSLEQQLIQAGQPNPQPPAVLIRVRYAEHRESYYLYVAAGLAAGFIIGISAHFCSCN